MFKRRFTSLWRQSATTAHSPNLSFLGSGSTSRRRLSGGDGVAAEYSADISLQDFGGALGQRLRIHLGQLVAQLAWDGGGDPLLGFGPSFAATSPTLAFRMALSWAGSAPESAALPANAAMTCIATSLIAAPFCDPPPLPTFLIEIDGTGTTISRGRVRLAGVRLGARSRAGEMPARDR
jgi:hypothetical protein